MRRDTENFSMYSLMSTRISADSIGEQELRERARQLGLSDARRAARR